MNAIFHSDSRLWQMSAVLAAVAVMAVGLAGCGHNDDAPPMFISAANTGNSPFIGVLMTATCANTVVGAAVIGTPGAPGKGDIVFGAPCAAPVRIEATGAGKMRPIGAKADGSEDVPYDPAFNLPISAYLDAIPAPGSAFTANPVTSLVANLVKQHGVSFADAKSRVETALGMNPGDADKDYSDPDVARASSRLAAITALVAQYAANGNVDLGGKTVGQLVEDTLAQAVMQAVIDGSANSLGTALGLANALKSKVDVTTDPSVTGLEIDNEANRVYNLLATVQGLDGQVTNTTAIPVGFTNISNAIGAMSGCAVDSHNAEVKKTAEKYKFAKKVSDINAGTSTTKPTDIAYANAIRKSAEDAQDLKIAVCGGNEAPLVLVSTTSATTSTTGSGTTTTGSGTTTTGSGTTTTGSGTTTTTAAATTTTTAAPTTTTTTIATPTTTSTTTTTTLTQANTINVPAGGGMTVTDLRLVGTNISGSGGVAYYGNEINFGPYTISGLRAPAIVTMIGPFTFGRTYQTMSRNGGARSGTEQTVRNGDTITLTINLAGYFAYGGQLAYATAYAPQIKIGSVVVTFSGIVTCADPAQPVSGYQTCQ